MNEVRILGLSGRKQSGKNTSLNFLMGCAMQTLDIIDDFDINQFGQLVVPDTSETGRGIFNVESKDPKVVEWLLEKVWPFMKHYSFADALKMMCVDILGLEYDLVYGNNDDKEHLTHLRWENMPGITTEIKDIPKRWQQYIQYHEPGFMKVREVLQYVGTDIFRRMYGDVWTDTLIKRRIFVEQPVFAIIPDVRFPNEVYGIQDAGGMVLRFTRNPFPEDDHFSETALDPDNFDWNRFDGIVDNADVSIMEHCQLFDQKLKDIEFFNVSLEEEKPTRQKVTTTATK